MYLKLGNITVNRQQIIDDFTIFIEVVDSSMSFERPVFIRNSEQLDIWFGKNFSDRDYFVELLNRGVSLYLYKPVSPKSDDPDFIDLENYSEYEEEVIYYNISGLPTDPELDIQYNVNGVYYVYVDESTGYVLLSDVGKYIEKPGQYKKLYKKRSFALPSTLPEEGEPEVKYWVIDPGVWYLWLDGVWVSENELPQNITNKSVSLNNRDVLALSDPDIQGLPEYFYPEYNEYSENHLGLFSNRKNLPGIKVVNNVAYYEDTEEEVNINANDILNGDTTLSIREVYTGESSGIISSGFQLIESIDINNPGNIVAAKNTSTIAYNGVPLPGDLYSKKVNITSILELKSVLVSAKYMVDVIEKGKEISAYSYKPFNLTYLNTFDSIKILNDQKLNNKILTQMFLPYSNLCMWSKTIGTDPDEYGEDKNIKVSIEKIGTYDYRIHLSRYDYSEYFEGTLFPEPGQRRLDDLISLSSRLVYCEIKDGAKALRTGEFTLRGAEIETYNKEMFWKSLNTIVSDEIYPDYLLIPDVHKYINNLDKDYSYYKEYETFLDIAKECNCQVLIQNNDFRQEEVTSLPKEQDSFTVYKIGGLYYLRGNEISTQYAVSLITAGNDYIFNYSNDTENRLIYFFRGMTSYLQPRPGYYIYLLGLLDNVFSASPDNIVYESPVSYPYDLDLKVVRVEELPKIPKTDTVYIIDEDYYLGSEKITDSKLISAVIDEGTKESLANHKSNYLVTNNQIYYYRGYENGEDYKTTAWMRFAIGKISRELLKNKWAYLSLRNTGRIRENIVAVLSRITRNFSVVNSISIELFRPVMNENKIDLILNTRLADLVDNNIVLDLTINYNKEN